MVVLPVPPIKSEDGVTSHSIPSPDGVTISNVPTKTDVTPCATDIFVSTKSLPPSDAGIKGKAPTTISTSSVKTAATTSPVKTKTPTTIPITNVSTGTTAPTNTKPPPTIPTSTPSVKTETNTPPINTKAPTTAQAPSAKAVNKPTHNAESKEQTLTVPVTPIIARVLRYATKKQGKASAVSGAVPCDTSSNGSNTADSDLDADHEESDWDSPSEADDSSDETYESDDEADDDPDGDLSSDSGDSDSDTSDETVVSHQPEPELPQPRLSTSKVGNGQLSDQIELLSSKAPRFLFRAWGASSGGGLPGLNSEQAIVPLAFLIDKDPPVSIHEMSRKEITRIMIMHLWHLAGIHTVFSSWSQHLSTCIGMCQGTKRELTHISIVDTTTLDKNNVVLYTPALQIVDTEVPPVYDDEFLIFGRITQPHFKTVPFALFQSNGIESLRHHLSIGEIVRHSFNIARRYGDKYTVPIAVQLFCLRPRSLNEQNAIVKIIQSLDAVKQWLQSGHLEGTEKLAIGIELNNQAYQILRRLVREHEEAEQERKDAEQERKDAEREREAGTKPKKNKKKRRSPLKWKIDAEMEAEAAEELKDCTILMEY